MTIKSARSDGFGDLHEARKPPVTTGRLRRTLAVYLSIIVMGALLAVLAPTASLRTLGVGLWYPGAGFLAAGGWSILLLPLFLLLFAISLVAWFGAGFTTLPPFVWLFGACLAALLAGKTMWAPGVIVAAGLLVAATAGYLVLRAKSRKTVAARREARIAYIPRVLREVEARKTAAPAQGDPVLELSAETLASLRYVFDHALQPIGEYTGYDRIDQFQTSALRYQINSFGYSLSVMQAHYTPNFHGYATEAQRRLIETYLDKSVWGYWGLENAWGNLRLSGDPVGKDNIMLTGFFGLQVGLYTALTGDDRYQQQAGLTFARKGKPLHAHNLHDIAESLVDNFRKAPFGLFPCEPNWTYTACNFRGMGALQVYDRVNGTDFFAELQANFRRRLETEFIKRDFGMVALKSKHTGIDLPFPLPEAVPAVYLNSMYPDLAARYWAIVREEQFVVEDGVLKPILPKVAVDPGTYKSSYALTFESLFAAAREFGDVEAADAALHALETVYEPVTSAGARSYRGISNTVNAVLNLDRLLQQGFWRDTVIRPTPESALCGPILEDAAYPDVLVARAMSSGDDLDLVLHPGAAHGIQTLTIARLKPGARYAVSAQGQVLVADSSGRLRLEVNLRGRTPVRIEPEDHQSVPNPLGSGTH